MTTLLAALPESWRVANLTPASPAHLVAYERDGIKASACNWVLPGHGVYLSRAEMVAGCSFACRRCLQTASGRKS